MNAKTWRSKTCAIFLAAICTVSLTPVAACSQARQPKPVDLAFEHLVEQMDRYHGTLDVYSDAAAAGNTFVATALIGDPSSTEMDVSSTESPHSGRTAIRASLKNTTGLNWGGFYFLNGALSGEETQPVPSMGERDRAWTNLDGATELTFWAKGARGGERVEFFTAGVGLDPVLGTKTAKYADSSPRIPTVGTVTRLTTTWEKYTIDLTSKDGKARDFSRIQGGFGWAASASLNRDGVLFWIDDIKFSFKEPRGVNDPRFIVSYVTIPSSNAFDRVLSNTAFSYDSALALLAFLARGTAEDRRRAGLLAEAFLKAQQQDRFYTDGRVRNANQAGHLTVAPGWEPNGKANTVRVPGFLEGNKWLEDRFQVSAHTGNVAWVGIALATYYELEGKKHANGTAYRDAAVKMGEWIEARAQRDGFMGYRGGPEGFEKPSAAFKEDPMEVKWASTEHNLDAVVLFRKLQRITVGNIWATRAEHALTFVRNMWEPDRKCFLTGTDENGRRNTAVLPLDPQAWSVLSAPELLKDYPEALECAEKNLMVGTDSFLFSFSDADKSAAWYEGTAQMSVAYRVAGMSDKADKALEALRRAQKNALHGNGKGLVAASAEELRTGFAWTYTDRLHIGATAWFIFAELGVNPYDLR